MELWLETQLTLIGGTKVIVQLGECANWSEAPNMELATRFTYNVEGETLNWGYAYVLSEWLTGEEMIQEFRQTVATWERLKAHV